MGMGPRRRPRARKIYEPTLAFGVLRRSECAVCKAAHVRTVRWLKACIDEENRGTGRMWRRTRVYKELPGLEIRLCTQMYYIYLHIRKIQSIQISHAHSNNKFRVLKVLSRMILSETP